MASLIKRSGTYFLRWTDSSRTPEQVGESLKTSDYKKAKRLKARLENEYFTKVDGERKHDPWQRKWYQEEKQYRQLTITRAVEHFIVYKSRARGEQGWGEVAQRNETFTMRKFARHVGEDRLLSTLDESDLEDFYYRDGVNSDHTRNSLYISINTFLNWCLEKGFIDTKPTYKPKKPQSKIPKYIEIEDLAVLIENEPWDWVRYGWMILASTGMRPKELSLLKVQHVGEHHIIIGADFDTKDKEERKVPILFEARYAIDKLTGADFTREHQPQYLLDRKPYYTRQKLMRRFSKRWDETFPDKPKKTLYNLKDLFAVRFLSNSDSGLKLNELKEILGHASLNTTQKYLKAIPYGTSLKGTIFDHAQD